MFLIKRPFFRCHSIRGRFQRYGKTNKKEEFCEEACCANGATATNATLQPAGIEKSRKADESRKTWPIKKTND
jgi:hypothetical protein